VTTVTDEGGDVNSVLDKAIVVFGDTNPGWGFRVPAGEELPEKALAERNKPNCSIMLTPCS